MKPPPRRLAKIAFDDGDMIALDEFTGRWAGTERANAANAIATLADATPAVGEPAVWVAKQVTNKLGGRLQILVPGNTDPPGTVH